MRFPRTDIVATGFVAVAIAVYLVWLAMDDVLAPAAVRTVTGLVLALGFAASATAVVPSVGQLLLGSLRYLVVTSVLGLVALVAGVLALVTASVTMLALLVATTVVMWALATTRHVREHRAEGADAFVSARHHVPRPG
jgi:hypothetical protein